MKIERLHLWLIRFIGFIVPRRLRADWRQEWEAELKWRESQLAEWDKLDWQSKRDLLRHSAGAFFDALWLQPKRSEDEVFQDVSFGIRMLLQQKSFTVAAVLCLALGIGANTTLFSLMSALLFRPPVATAPAELVTVGRGRGLAPPLSHSDFVVFREKNDVLSGLAASQTLTVTFGDDERSELLLAEAVSGNYFDVLGVQPTVGRAFRAEEDDASGALPAVVLGHQLWRSHFNGNPQVTGQTVTLNGKSFTVIGVAPQGVGQAVVPGNVSVWIPSAMLEQVSPGQRGHLQDRHAEEWDAIGRLKPGVSLQQAQVSLDALNRQIELADPRPAASVPSEPENRSLTLTHPRGLTVPHLRRLATMITGLLAAIVGTVLLLSCANVANLLLARAAARRREIAARLALGASRWRLMRQLLTESSLLGSMGGGAGLLLAFWLNRALMAFQPPNSPPWSGRLDLRLDLQVLGWTLLLSMMASLVFGLVPALQASQPALIPALKGDDGAETSRRRRVNWRDGLVVAQVAASLVLLISAGLFVRSLRALHFADPGFRVDQGLTLSVQLEGRGYDDVRGAAFVQQLLERAAALPGVQAVSAVNYLPLGQDDRTTGVFAPGRESQAVEAGLQIISGNYFPTMGLPLVRGRDFGAQDTAMARQVAVINTALASRLFPDEDALGKELRDTRWGDTVYEIVGIATDSAYRTLGEAPRSVLYRPFAQSYSPTMHLVAHTAVSPQSLFAAVRREMKQLDPSLPVSDLRTLREHVTAALTPTGVATTVLSALSLLGLFLAAVGIYGVMSFAVARRTREIGVRMALGAGVDEVRALMLRKGLSLTLTGAVIGLLLAFGVTRLLGAMLYGVSATDFTTFAGVTSFLVAVALFACYLPARRATAVNPLVALRHD